MTWTARSSHHDETLQKTAARLIYILGLDEAIETCRSNDWPAVLRFVLAYKTSLDRQTRPCGSARPTPPWLVTNRYRTSPIDSKPAIAA